MREAAGDRVIAMFLFDMLQYIGIQFYIPKKGGW